MSDSIAQPDASQEVLADIQREYEQTLSVPDQKPSSQWMLMPVGLIGSGKTTAVKLLAAHFGLVRISTDEIREQLRLRGYTFEGCREVVQELIKKYLGLGYSLACDANTGSKIGLEYNTKTMEAFPQIRMIFIHLNPPEEFIIKNLKIRQKPLIFRNAEHAIERFYFHKKTFSFPIFHSSIPLILREMISLNRCDRESKR